MSDARTRTLERAAAAGDMDAAVRLLREESRLVAAGEWPWDGLTGRWALAAHCGHEACLALVDGGRDYSCTVEGDRRAKRSRDLADWLEGLARWPKEAMLRAAVAAARVALEHWMGDMGWWLARRIPGAHDGDGLAHISLKQRPETEWRPIENVVQALEAVQRYIEESSEETDTACADMAVASLGNSLPEFVDRLVLWIGARSKPDVDDLMQSLRASARVAGETPVRAAICKALIAWALGEEARTP